MVASSLSEESRELLRLKDEVSRSLDAAWYRTAQWEKALFPMLQFKAEAEQNITKLKEAEVKLKRIYRLLNKNFPHSIDLMAALYMEFGRCAYLTGKALFFADQKGKVKDYYQQAHVYFEKALMIYTLLNDPKGKINSIRHLAIVDDQDVNGASTIVAKRFQVIGPLNDLFHELSLKHSSYDSAFEAFLHITEVMIGVIFANVGRNSSSTKPTTGFRAQVSKLTEEIGKVSIKLMGGYLFAWLFINTLILKPLIQYLLTKTPLAVLPSAISDPIVSFFKWAFPHKDLIECFELKANIHHDLMKGYEKIHEDNKATFHRKQSQFYFKHVIQMLDPVRDVGRINQMLEYME